MNDVQLRRRLVWRIRLVLLFFFAALVASGLTAVPLAWELDILAAMLGIDTSLPADHYTGLQYWIAYVHEGIHTSYTAYPFLAYGTDWLAFAHCIIAVALLGPIRDPVRNVWVIDWAMIACVAIFPVALGLGPLRGIPFYWQLIDCSFGFFGFLTLLPVRMWTARLGRMT